MTKSAEKFHTNYRTRQESAPFIPRTASYSQYSKLSNKSKANSKWHNKLYELNGPKRNYRNYFAYKDSSSNSAIQQFPID